MFNTESHINYYIERTSKFEIVTMCLIYVYNVHIIKNASIQ